MLPPPCARPQSEKVELEREFEEIKRQLEEDADREIEELKEKWVVGVVGRAG